MPLVISLGFFSAEKWVVISLAEIFELKCVFLIYKKNGVFWRSFLPFSAKKAE